MLTAPAIKQQASTVGFDLCGIARAVRHPRLARLAQWYAAGEAGEMRYLADLRGERADPRVVLPTARSVVSLAVLYNTNQTYSTRATGDGRVAIARYAWGMDYHDVLRDRLRQLLRWMRDEAGPGFEAMSCVDDGPVQERVLAEQAGLGWIGKNTCLINPRVGSWLFLAEILTNTDLDPDTPGLDQCGACTRCLDACPTGALVEPYRLDARRCLSYLTIEVRGAVPDEWRPAIGEQVFGCDICQDVCPWNARALESADPAWHARSGLAFPRLIDLCRLNDDAWRDLIAGSALRRAGLARLRRSLAYAAAARPTPEAAHALDALAAHPSASAPVVADAIAWSRAQLATRER
jgi:epoxyqueuosine reductase